nr:dynactin subunit 1-like [Aegilops tauschii subsp. strangulata]
MPQYDLGWARAKLSDDRAAPVLEKMNADLKPGNAKAAKLTGAMLLREFLMLRVAPLQARSRPLWTLGGEEDKLRLSPVALSDEELAVALRLLVGDDQEYPPSTIVPLFHRKDGAQVAAAMPTFGERGLVPPAPLVVPEATVPVLVSSSNILRTLRDDDEADVPQEKEDQPVIPTRDRSALISRDAASARTPPGAASGPSAAPSSAPGARAPVPQAVRLSGFKLSKRRVDNATVDQPPPVAKKRKEDTVTPPGADPSAAAAPPSVGKGSDSARTSLAQSASRGPEGHPREESAPVALLAPEALMPGAGAEIPKAQEPPASQAMVTLSPLPPPAAPLVPSPSASPDILERALSEMTRLREDLQGAEPHLAAGRLKLVSGWLHSDVSVRAVLSQAVATSEGEKQAAAQAAAACEAAMKDAKAAQDRCRALEAELKALRDKRAEEARGRKVEEEKMKAREDAVKGRDAELAQAIERGWLEELEQNVKAEKPELDAKVKVLAEDRVAFALFEERSRTTLKALYKKGLEKVLTTDEDVPAQLLPYLVEALEEVVSGIGPMAEEEARVLSSAALTRVFSHPHLRDPTTRLDELLEPVNDEHCAAAAASVKGQVEALLKKFRAFARAPLTDGATNPAAPAGGAGEGDATKEGASFGGAGGVQG